MSIRYPVLPEASFNCEKSGRETFRMPVSALAPKELKPFREREPSWRRQSPSRSGSLSSGYRWFESISLQRRVQCEPDADDFLAAGGAVLAEPLADRAQHEMPAQPVLCRPVVIRETTIFPIIPPPVTHR